MSKVPCGGFELDESLALNNGKLGLAPGVGGVQADWNQNDDTQSGYVKNRPFWREKTKKLLFPYITEPIEVTTEDNGSGFFFGKWGL